MHTTIPVSLNDGPNPLNWQSNGHRTVEGVRGAGETRQGTPERPRWTRTGFGLRSAQRMDFGIWYEDRTKQAHRDGQPEGETNQLYVYRRDPQTEAWGGQPVSDRRHQLGSHEQRRQQE